jgi:N-acetylneuraminic acid mutarotase
MSATPFGDTILLFGGSHSSQMFVPKENYYGDVYSFDPVTFTFTPLPSMPIARNMAFAGVIGDAVLVVGGMKSPGATANQCYEPLLQRWEIRAEMPQPRGGHAGVVIQTPATSALLILGGANAIDVYTYDPATNSWGRATSIPAPRNMAFAAVVPVETLGETVYLIGGMDDVGAVSDAVYQGLVVEAG